MTINKAGVLRVKKLKATETTCIQKDVEQIFFEKIIKNLIRNELCPSLKTVQISDKKRIQEIMKSYTNLCFDCVSIMPDYTKLHETSISRSLTNTYCVELKPKQGWIPKIDRCFGCIFCKMQLIKLMKGKVVKRSHYCPLDLFSGNKCRMYKAFNNLLKSPQNNLTILRNSVCVFDENSSLDNLKNVFQEIFSSENNFQINYQKFCSLILTALSENVTKKSIKIRNSNFYDGCTFSDFLGTKCSYFQKTKLKKNCVLYEILKNQQLLNRNLDYSYRSKNSLFGYINDISISTRSVNNLETVHENQTSDFNYKSVNDFHNYLVASVFNDCSILITFQKRLSSDFEIATLQDDQFIIEFEFETDDRFVFCVKIIDLGPKPTTCFEHHRKRFMNFHDYFFQYFN